MLINLPPNFGAALLRKRAARGAPRRRGISTGDPVTDLQNLAAEHGYEGDPGDLQAMADFVWAEVPTDGVGALLEDLAAQGLIRTPW
jgi:hypothetical protein